MKRYITLLLLALVSLATYSCQDLVNNVDPPIDQVNSDKLTTENQIPFLITGVQTRFSTTYDRLALQSGGLSDEEIFDQNVPNATFPTFRQIDNGAIELDNNSVDGVFNDLGELRFFSDDLVRRVGEIEFEDADLKNKALYIGNFYGGMARYFYAVYFGLEPTKGGGVIDSGPFIPSSDMFNLALDKLNESLNYVPSAYEAKVVNSLIARIQLIQGNYTEADNALANALASGDDPFMELHSVESSNEFWANGGKGRTQFVADFYYHDTVVADSQEANRIVLASKLGNDEQTTYYFQNLYPNNDSPLPFTTWQEVNLMKAEVALMGTPSDPATARQLIDEVRASHNIDPVPLTTTVDMDFLIEERRKELFTMGLRLIDERRFDIFHLPAGSWQYLPITQSERNQNSNIE